MSGMAAPIEQRSAKWKVSKHPDPRCEYPWEVDGPDGELSDVFTTWAEAHKWAATASRMRNDKQIEAAS